MSRRRGVVQSDDEESVAAPSRPSNAHSGSRKQGSRGPTEGPIPDLPAVAKLSPEEVQKLRLLTADHQATTMITSAMNIVNDTAVAVEELEVSDENKERVAMLEKRLRDLIDVSQHLKHSNTSLERTWKASEDATEPVALHEIFINETAKQDEQYNAKTAEEKYANVAEFLDFKRRVWDVHHPNVPQPDTWFPSDSGNSNDDDIVVDHEVQSLKCPITLQLLEKPVRNTDCPHVYSLDAIKELVRHGRGRCNCPVAGCTAKVTMDSVREDKVMARKIREEKAREEERAGEMSRETQELPDEMSEIVYDDDDVKVQR